MRLTTSLRSMAAAAVIAAAVAACSGTSGRLAAARSPMALPTSPCHAGVSGAENWIMGSGELSAAQSASPSSVQYAVSSAHLLVLLLRGQTRPGSQAVADFRSYAAFKKAISRGTIPAGVHWVMYDNERWSLTPPDEQANPVRYERLFARLAHGYGYKVILAPALDLAPRYDRAAFRRGKAQWRAYLSMGLAAVSARYGDIYEIQAQPYEVSVFRSRHTYAEFVAAAAAQARAVNPGIVIYAGLSTKRVSSAAQLFQDYLATRDLVDGYWLNIPRHNKPGPPTLADQFLRRLPLAVAAGAQSCGSI